MKKFGASLAVFAVVVLTVCLIFTHNASAGRDDAVSSYKVLQPIAHGNLTIFPVVVSNTHDTSDFITLDEGTKSGEVVITEAGRANPLVRRRQVPITGDSAQVNRLVLVNNSDRPLILLAGEIVTGGKQDRVIGKDRLVPAQSDPVDLGVFCVEPGRWVARSDKFVPLATQMAAPSVRNRAMADKDQSRVWDEVRKSNAEMVQVAPGAAAEVATTTSYAGVVNNSEVKARVDAVAAPVAKEYESVRSELHKKNAVGVVVAVNGRIIWADLFASPALLDKYWPKLVRSYAAEAVTMRAAYERDARVDVADAQRYLNEMEGYREVTETEPGLFRYAESTAPGFKVFALTSLLPKSAFTVHIAKMRTAGANGPELMREPYMERR